MANSVITADKLKHKATGLSSEISDVVTSDTLGNLKTVGGKTDITVDNSNKLGGQTLDEVRSGIDAATIGGYSPDQLLTQDRFSKVRMLLNTEENGYPERWNVAVTETDDILWWGYNNTAYFVNGAGADIQGVYTLNNPNRASRIKDIVASCWSLYVLYEDGKLFSLGHGAYGKLGNGSTSNALDFVLVAEDVVKVSTGSSGYHQSYNHTMILKADGTVWGTGRNSKGQLGIGNTTDQTVFTQSIIPSGVGTPIDVIACNTENAFTYVITDTGKLLATGYNGNYAIGDGSTTDTSAFKQVTTLDSEEVIAVVPHGGTRSGDSAYYRNSTMVLTKSNKVFAWGANAHGQCGDGTTSAISSPVDVTANIPSPHDVVTNPIVKIVSSKAEWGSFYLLTKNGDLFTIGQNGYGNLGDGTTTNSSAFLNVLSDVKYVQVMAGGTYCYFRTVYALTNSGDLYTWGYNAEGQMGVNHTTQINSPTKVAFEHSAQIKQISNGGYSSSTNCMLLLEDGRVFGVGDDDYQTVVPLGSTAANIRRFVRTL